MDPLIINAVVFQQDGMWVAQCLEYNFVSCATTRDELPRALMQQVLAQIEVDLEAGHDPFFEFEPAPARCWEMLEQAKRQSTPILRRFTSPELKSVETKLFPVAA